MLARLFDERLFSDSGRFGIEQGWDIYRAGDCESTRLGEREIRIQGFGRPAHLECDAAYIGLVQS